MYLIPTGSVSGVPGKECNMLFTWAYKTANKCNALHCMKDFNKIKNITPIGMNLIAVTKLHPAYTRYVPSNSCTAFKILLPTIGIE